jgi:hypothetical protein
MKFHGMEIDLVGIFNALAAVITAVGALVMAIRGINKVKKKDVEK